MKNYRIEPIYDGQGGTIVTTYQVIGFSFSNFNITVFSGTYIECINFVNNN